MQFPNCDSDSDPPCKRMFLRHPTESTIKHQSGISNMDSETFLSNSVKYIKKKRMLQFHTLEIHYHVILWCHLQFLSFRMTVTVKGVWFLFVCFRFELKYPVDYNLVCLLWRTLNKFFHRLWSVYLRFGLLNSISRNSWKLQFFF